MSENKLNVIDLHKRYGEHEVLKGVSLQANAGDVISIIGSSGSGKSTFLRCINFLEKPSEGSIVVNGQTINLVRDKDGQLKVADKNQLRLLRTRLTMVFQHFNLFPHMTCLENITYAPIKVKKIPKEQAVARAKELLKMVGLESKADVYPAHISGGQKQRVAIAGVMAMRPQCIVLDEPTAMLDPNGRKEVLEAVHQLNRQENVTVVLITHYMEEVIDADRVVVMDDGHVVMEGTPKEIFSQVETLKKYRLDVPQVTLLAHELHKAGVDIPEGILTKEELVGALCR